MVFPELLARGLELCDVNDDLGDVAQRIIERIDSRRSDGCHGGNVTSEGGVVVRAVDLGGLGGYLTRRGVPLISTCDVK